MQNAKVRRAALAVAAAASATAIAVHGYLAWVHYSVHFGDATGDRICNVGEFFNCEAVSASKYAEFLGVPMAVWGMAFNGAFIALLAAYAIAEQDRRRARAAAGLAFAGAILAASAAMGGISAFAMVKYCLFCIFAYALSAVSFAGAWMGLKSDALAKPRPGERGSLSAGFAPAAIAAAIAAALAALGNWKAVSAYGAQDLGPIAQRAAAEWIASPAKEISPFAPIAMGASPEAAKMTIVEFADFRCGHCKHAAPVLHAFAAGRPDVRFLFQPWPLDGACNPKIPGGNGASCMLARASYCATKMGEAAGRGHQAGWAAHKWMFDRQEKFMTLEGVERSIDELGPAIGFEPGAFKACIDGQESKDAVAKQSEVGIALDIPGTPAIFANGRKLSYGQVLAVLIGAYERADEAPPANRP